MRACSAWLEGSHGAVAADELVPSSHSCPRPMSTTGETDIVASPKRCK